MKKEWQELTKLTGSQELVVERVKIESTDISIKGEFTLPPMARLSADDQIFVAAFVRCHGSIKQMEKFYGVSYPTIKNRLNRIGQQLEFVQIEPVEQSADTLDRLQRGEITVDEAIQHLKKGKNDV